MAIQFTSLAAWVPLGILFAKNKQLTLCALLGLAGLGISLVVDRYFFGFWVLHIEGNEMTLQNELQMMNTVESYQVLPPILLQYGGLYTYSEYLVQSLDIERHCEFLHSVL